MWVRCFWSLGKDLDLILVLVPSPRGRGRTLGCNLINAIAEISQLGVKFALALDQGLEVGSGGEVGAVDADGLGDVVEAVVKSSGKFVAGDGAIAAEGAVGITGNTAGLWGWLVFGGFGLSEEFAGN